MNHSIIVGLGYGDEGKGSITDYLCSPKVPEPGRLVVRYNGGAQAAHNVVLPDGRHHTFAQFGSGTLQGARTHLSRFMLVNPLTLGREADRLEQLGIKDPLGMMTIDPRALVTTPYHVMANRLREQRRGDDRHGSTGMGIWETVSFAEAHPDLAMKMGHLTSHARILSRLMDIKLTLEKELAAPLDGQIKPWDIANDMWLLACYIDMERDNIRLGAALKGAPVVFEGAQGVLLDKDHGEMPHVSGTTTTPANAVVLLTEVDDGIIMDSVRVIGVTRTYMTRHGSGPFPTENDEFRKYLPEPHNLTGEWQGEFRFGDLDIVALKNALGICGGADSLAVTHCDAMRHMQLMMCTGYQYGSTMPAGHESARSIADYLDRMAELLDVPLGILSHGPTADDKTLALVPEEH